jgi:hypothetical protein
MRVKITLACTETGDRNYITQTILLYVRLYSTKAHAFCSDLKRENKLILHLHRTMKRIRLA